MVGNKHCSYGLCNSDARYSHKDHMKGVFFIPFPKPQRNIVRSQQWVRACGRAEFTIANIKRNSYICSKHFVSSKGPTSEHPDPLPFVATDADIKESETRGKVGRKHRKRINVAPSVTVLEPENNQQSEKVDNKSQCVQVMTLPNVVPECNLTTSCSTPSANVLVISEPNKVLNKLTSLTDGTNSGNIAESVKEHLRQTCPTQVVPSSGGQIVAVKNFVIHGQKYTAVHINSEKHQSSSFNVRAQPKQQHFQGDGIFISRNNVNIAIPRTWSVQEDSNVFTFRRISSSDSVLLSIIFNEETGEIKVKVLGMQITSHPILECVTNSVTLNNITFILKQFDRWKVCKGNPDEKFQAVFHQRPKSSAYYSWIDDSVHSNTCELLSLKERCTPCKKYRGYLRCVLNRLQKKQVHLISALESTNAGSERSADEDDDEQQMLE